MQSRRRALRLEDNFERQFKLQETGAARHVDLSEGRENPLFPRSGRLLEKTDQEQQDYRPNGAACNLIENGRAKQIEVPKNRSE